MLSINLHGLFFEFYIQIDLLIMIIIIKKKLALLSILKESDGCFLHKRGKFLFKKSILLKNLHERLIFKMQF